jgi:hypothetical protein
MSPFDVLNNHINSANTTKREKNKFITEASKFLHVSGLLVDL